MAAVTSALRETGNPSSLHTSGRAARLHVEEARERVAAALGAQPTEVVFTSGGTEADNLAVKGLYWGRRQADPRRRRIIASSIEHHAVMDSLQWLASHEGAEVEWLPVDRLGRVRLDALNAALDRDPETIALVTVMWANNEVGTVQPIAEVVEAAHAHGIPVHCDAVQAVGQLSIDFAASGLDTLALSGHKIGATIGVGALLARRDAPLVPVMHGGGQERDVRSGTLDTAAITGLGLAVTMAEERRAAEVVRLTRLRDRLVDTVQREVPDAVRNGDPAGLPGIAHLSFPGCEGDSLLLLLDSLGIDCSTGAACAAGVAEPSHVLMAMGVDESLVRASLRFSLGHTTTDADIDAVATHIGPVVERARAAGLVNVAGVS